MIVPISVTAENLEYFVSKVSIANKRRSNALRSRSDGSDCPAWRLLGTKTVTAEPEKFSCAVVRLNFLLELIAAPNLVTSRYP